jgi:hypothetical protein
MSVEATIEKRVSELEERVARLTEEMFRQPGVPRKPGWIRKVVGSMANDSEFAEILRLGREIREADRPESDSA